MVLPASGQITFNQIQTEFGGSNPISMNEYYRGTGNVRNFGAGTGFINGSIPTGTVGGSTQISATNFYGGASLLAFPGQTAFSSSFTPQSASAEISVQPNGTAQLSYYDTTFNNVVTQQIGPWYTGPNSGATFEIIATIVSGGFDFGSGVNTWLSMSTTRSWGIQTSGLFFESRAVVFDLEFRLASNTSRLSNKIRVTLQVNTEQGGGGGGGFN